MAKKYLLFFLVFFILTQSNGQIVVTMDNDDPEFSTVGQWKQNSNASYHNGTAYYKDKGDGSALSIWKGSLLFPGLYKIETHSFNYKFGKDTHWRIQSGDLDTTLLVDMYYNPGWLEMGAFQIGDSVTVTLSDYFASDSGTRVFADGLKFTSMMPLYQVQMTIHPTGENQNCDVNVILFKENTPLDTVISDYKNRFVVFSGLPSGAYRIVADAVGYQQRIVYPVVIADTDESLSLDLTPAEPLFSISGSVDFYDGRDDIFCKTVLYFENSRVAIDSVKKGEQFTLPGIPEGNYTLQYLAEEHAIEEVSVTVRTSNIDLTPVLMYPEFKFVWITDSHIGLSFTDPPFQQLVQKINDCPENIDFVMHTGDVTEHGYNFELERAKDYMDDLNYPFYISIGNHDTKWTESGLRRYQALFGELYYSFDHKGFHFINLNNAITLRGDGGYFNPAQYEWLKNDLAAMDDPNTPVIVMYHIPSSEDAVPNHWQITNILKDYRIAMIFTGHGHSNRVYDFDGLPGIMAMDTYNANQPSGFHVVSVSEKELRFTPYYNTSGKGNDWHVKACADSAGTRMTFRNIEPGSTLTASAVLQVELSKNATGGSWLIRPEYKSGSLTGTGKNWEFTIDPSTLENGYHFVKVSMMIDGGNMVYKTFAFYTERGDYPKAVWRFDAQDEILSKPAYDGEKVYFGSGKGAIYALDAATGDLVWKKEDMDDAVYSSPAVEKGVLYTGTSKGTMYALDAEDGREIWTYSSGNSIHSGILVVDTMVYSGSGTSLIALSGTTGKRMWSFAVNDAVEARPVVSGDRIVFTSWDTKVYCLDRFTGTKKWHWSHQSSMYYAPGAGWPVIMNGYVYVVDPKKYMSCINLETGALEWQSDNPNVWDSIGKNEEDTQVYIRALDGKLYAFKPSGTRELLWSVPANFGFDAKPSMPFGKRGSVFAGGSSGNLISVSQVTGELKWIYHTANTLVNSVTPRDGVSAYITCLDGTAAFIQGDPSLDIESGKIQQPENMLLPSYPNPFNNTTTIRYTLKEPQKVTIYIYDLLGKQVMKRNCAHQTSGYYSFQWHGVNEQDEGLASGLYLLRLEGNSFIDQKKLLFLK
ncbi:MAG: PQQ-binding-like beta-propeller repeat protein [Candidatus Marinimicrobia bacterium]|nr:PQQ-binding-like beta-propeller repeat protein [Candidatus Neomarinimicrobiota bacterium]